MRRGKLFLIIIMIILFLADSCKKNSDSKSESKNNTPEKIKPVESTIWKLHFNDNEAHIDYSNNIIISNIKIPDSKEIKIKFLNNDKNSSFSINNQVIHNYQNIFNIVKKKKAILKKTNKDGTIEEYNLYFSSLPVLNIKTDNIDNFPNINKGYAKIDSLNSELYINVTDNLSNLQKKSFAIYTNNDFTDYISYKFNIISKENIYYLLANNDDPSLIRDRVSQNIFYEKLGNNLKSKKIKGKHIDLFINNEYWGIYYISNIVNTSALNRDNLSDTLELNWQKKGNDNYLYSVINNQSDILINPFDFKFSKTPTFESEKLSIDLSKCDYNLEKTFEPNYANSFLTTILAIKGSNNITNNSFVALSKGNVSDFVNSNYNNDNKLFYILWDADQSFGSYQRKINYNRFDVVFDHFDYIKNRGSLVTCYLHNVNNFKINFVHKWIKENNSLPGFIKSSLINNFKYLENNMAYEREFIRWKNNKFINLDRPFDSKDLDLMLNWVDKRFKFLEEDFLKIPTTTYNKYKIKKLNGDPVVIHRTQFNFNHFKLIPIIAKDRMETHDDATKRTNALVVATGGFFKYYYNNQFIHDKVYSYFVQGPEGCHASGKYPTTNFKANTTGVFKEKNKYHSISKILFPAIGWNDNGEYVIGNLSIVNKFNFRSLGKIFDINHLNEPLEKDSFDINLFNSSFDNSTNTPSGTFEITINSDSNSIESISTSGNSNIPENGYVISFGTKVDLEELKLGELKIGEVVDINYIYNENIMTSNTTKSFEQMDYIRSTNQILVLNNNIDQDVLNFFKGTNTKRAHLKGSHPRAALCIKNNNWNLYVIDGRQPNISKGMTMYELAHYLKDEGCNHAINFDGGASAAITFRGFKMNINSGMRGKCTNVSRPIADFMTIQRK
ncbi:phosphodiester glycosidase family protein [Pigmentibacter sp. JX0631]|uniref:phosphodiester glycosidase family protein n=1 Tax=Pigmentibacter sp. JX0631 TaxID=2976982 RepID=UPI0024694930|nr:phosphodiester glycosidase family protein [Pigmentibacter sp. JX0631]WGL60284.1 phosphodiester glycosidase family protein [Pigmentibacter sp. JX0631]